MEKSKTPKKILVKQLRSYTIRMLGKLPENRLKFRRIHQTIFDKKLYYIATDTQVAMLVPISVYDLSRHFASVPDFALPALNPIRTGEIDLVDIYQRIEDEEAATGSQISRVFNSTFDYEKLRRILIDFAEQGVVSATHYEFISNNDPDLPRSMILVGSNQVVYILAAILPNNF